MRTVVVCDDDDVLRGVIRELAEEAGLEVVAETDHGMDVVELVRRFDIDVVVLDLALPDVSGENVLRLLRSEGLAPLVIVYTAYEPDHPAVQDLGARWVIHKPGLDELTAALAQAVTAPPEEVGAGGGSSGPRTDRRAPRRSVEIEAPLWRSPSGVEPAASLGRHLDTCQEGDTLVAVAPDDLDSVARRFGQLLAHDCLLTAARASRAAIRTQDSVIDEPDCDGLLLVLRGGDDRAGSAAWGRIRTNLDAEPGDLSIRGAWTVVGDSATEARARVVGTVRGAMAGSFNPT